MRTNYDLENVWAKSIIESPMKPNRFILLLSITLVSLSAILFSIQYLVFRDTRDTFFYLFQDVAFLPMQVMLVTIVLDRIMRITEKRERLTKQNMVIGTFFSEMGAELLKYFSSVDPNIESVRENLVVKGSWIDKDYKAASMHLAAYQPGISIDKVNFEEFKTTLVGHRVFLLGLLENQNLLEHERFTDVLWATFHLLEELMYRKDFSQSPRSDLEHLAGDMKRAYQNLICQWIDYMQHLKVSYPYLFSLAQRTNPFDPTSKVEVAGK
jgi:hypothetical protein